MVLVDVEPIGGFRVDSSAESMESGMSSDATIEALPGHSEDTDAMKMALLWALDARDSLDEEE